MHEDDFFEQKPFEKAYCCVKMTGAAMVRPASSDFWKGPQEMDISTRTIFAFFKLKFSHFATAKAFSFSANEATHQVI